MVRLSKPAQTRESPFIDKTDGGNNDAGCCGKNVCLQAWDYIKGNLSRWKVTGGADFTTKPVQLIGMRKGSVHVRGVAPKGSYAVWVFDGLVAISRHWPQKTTDYSARGKVRGVLYWVEQNFIQQQSQHIAVGSVIG